MPLEENLANAAAALAETNLLVRGLYDAERERVDGKIDEVDGALANLRGILSVEYSLDQANGDDANEGTQNSPIRTAQEAVNRVPEGGVGVINITGDLDLDEARIFMNRAQTIVLRGEGAGISKLRPGLHASIAPQADLAMGSFFAARGLSSVLFLEQLEIVLPVDPLDGSTIRNANDSCLLGGGTAVGPTQLELHLTNCELTVPPNAVGRLLGTNERIGGLSVHSTIFDEAAMAGRWVQNIAAGTDPNTLPSIVTNLASL